MRESATTLVEQAIANLDRTEPDVHAYARVFEKQALEQARQLDGEADRGPLHGVPFAVKEVFEVAGVETTGGSRALAGRIAEADAAVVQRLRSSGAVLIGTQVSHELTCGLDEPPTRNPWNLACYPGGSSAGAGVSVAVGSALFALGTDAAGSVRIPAAMTGVVGFKPSMGAVSKRGVIREASAPSIDNVGIVARDVALVAHVFGAISFADAGDTQSLLRRPHVSKIEVRDLPSPEGRRIAILGERTMEMLDRIFERQTEVKLAFERCCERLASRGARLVELELPGLAQAGNVITTFFSQELAFAHRKLLHARGADYHPQVREMLAAAMAASPTLLDEVMTLRMGLAVDVERGFGALSVDALLTPTTPRVAMPLADFDPTKELGTLIPYTCGFNLTGHPAISIPNGVDGNGMPIGVQLVGKRYDDHALLQLAAGLEQPYFGLRS
ncbi:MAG: amidase [Mesorhizobium sp.]|nr:amidase [Mesorhizobium sp.]